MQVDNTTVDIPLALASSSEGPDLDLDFTLTLGNKVRLYNPALYDLMVNGRSPSRATSIIPIRRAALKRRGGPSIIWTPISA